MPKVAKAFSNGSELVSLRTKVNQTLSRLDKFQDKKKKNKTRLQTVRQDIVDSIKDMRGKINERLDVIEKGSLAELDNQIAKLDKELESNIDSCARFREQTQKLLDDIECYGEQFESFAFATSKLCEEKLANVEDLLVSFPEQEYQLEFISNTQIEKLLSSLDTFGSFNITPDFLQSSDTDHVYEVVGRQTVNVRQRGDKQKCYITGLCQLPGGPTALVDNQNKKVKLLDSSTYAVVAEVELPQYPFDICNTTGTELAVTVSQLKDLNWVRHEVHFLNTRNEKLTRTNIVQFSHPCCGIVHASGHLYVSNGTGLYIYTLAGQPVKKVYEVAEETIWGFTLSYDERMIYITNWWKNLLLTLDNTGQHVSTLRGVELKRPCGICMSGRGTVFVCGKESNVVCQVNREGSHIVTTLAASSEGIHSPASLWYHRRTQQLFVGQHDDHVMILKLK